MTMLRQKIKKQINLNVVTTKSKDIVNDDIKTKDKKEINSDVMATESKNIMNDDIKTKDLKNQFKCSAY